MGTPTSTSVAMTGMAFTDPVNLIPVMAAAFGFILGAVALGIGWQSFRGHTHPRYRRGVQVPPQHATGHDPGGGP